QRVAFLQQKITDRQKEQKESIEWAKKESEKIPETRRAEIAGMDFKKLQASLQSGSISAVETLSTYIGLSLAAHDKTQLVTVYDKDCVAQAAAMDERVKRGEKLPPLAGIPISIKESCSVTGTDRTWGYAAGVGFKSTVDAPFIAYMKELGAIPFVKTNVPLSLITYTCGNSVYGWTENPRKKGRTPGGSTGGEAALIGAGGSILGIGADVGGSIRMPAHYSGIAGVKPSSMRLSVEHLDDGYMGPALGLGHPMIEHNEGPMAPTAEIYAETLKHVWSSSWISDHDPYKAPVMWRNEMYEEGKKYRIGYYTDDGWFTATPGCVRVVNEAKDKLEKMGHTLVPFFPPPILPRCAVSTLALSLWTGHQR
ncbi:hypothetical protein PFISCL1PPCAC_7009, partial [Pristionchus fissidentatus]